MNFFVENWVLILLAFVSGGMLLWPMVQRSSGGGSAVSPNEAVRLINREKAVIIDVCEAGEYAAGHAIGARNVPLGQLDGAKALPSNKALPVVLICATGARSARGAAQLRKAGYEKAFTVAGGNGAWRDAQLPMEKSA